MVTNILVVVFTVNTDCWATRDPPKLHRRRMQKASRARAVFPWLGLFVGVSAKIFTIQKPRKHMEADGPEIPDSV